MDPTTHRYLLSQRADLSDLIERAPEGSIITRSGLEHRLREIEAQLVPYEGVLPHMMQARLVFAGVPVVGDYGHRGRLLRRSRVPVCQGCGLGWGFSGSAAVVHRTGSRVR